MSKLNSINGGYNGGSPRVRSENSKKLKDNVCTLDFSTPYIQTKTNRAKGSDRTLLLFCWDTDSYRLLKPENVTSVVPLSSILRNGK